MSTQNNYEVGWGDLSNEAASTSNVNFMKLADGTNQIRIVSSPAKLFIHWEKDINGKWHKIVCNTTTTCPICQKGITAVKKFCMTVIDRKDENKIKLLEVGPMIAQKLGTLAKDPDYGNPINYDIRIIKSGTGFNTNYEVTPRPQKTPLTEEEQQAIDAFPKIDAIMKVMEPEEILALNLECLSDSLQDLAEDSNTTTNPNATTEAEDDWDDI